MSSAKKTATQDASANDAALTGPAACAAVGGQCVIGGGQRCSRIGQQDCNPDRNPGGAVCCLDRVFADCNTKSFQINASDYDQTCGKDSDCVEIGEGNACIPCSVLCPNAAINTADLTAYRKDLEKTPARAIDFCGCPAAGVPRCADRLCQVSKLPNTAQNACEVIGGECVADAERTCHRAGLQDCGADGGSNAAMCCLDPLFAECDAGKTFPIKASDYDQTCSKDSDCTGIGEGDGCNCEVDCQNAAINVTDKDTWQRDLVKTPARLLSCHCPAASIPCCVNNYCQSGLAQCGPH